jgi:hypothetical protein
MKNGRYKFSSRICCLIMSVWRQYECLRGTYLQQHEKILWREKSKKKNGRSQATRLLRFWETQTSFIQDTLHASPIRTISIFIQRSTFICVQGDRERGFSDNIHGDQKVSIHLIITYAFQQITPISQLTCFLPHYLVQFDCLAADRQGQGDTRLTLTPSVILNSKYVIVVSDWNCLKYFCVFFVL